MKLPDIASKIKLTGRKKKKWILAGGVLVLIRTIGEYTMSALLYGVFNRPISISMVTNMQEYKVGISLAYGVIVIAICYVALAVIFKLDKKRFL